MVPGFPFHWILGLLVGLTGVSGGLLLGGGRRVVVDEKGVKVQTLWGSWRSLSWRELIGREEERLKGLHSAFTLPAFMGYTRILALIDAILERRTRGGGMRPLERPSQAALMEVEPETTGEPSAAALAEVEEAEAKPRLTGRELETQGDEEGRIREMENP
jgi:hypothetical protein